MLGGRRGTAVIIGMRGEPAVAEASMMFQHPEVCHVFSWGSCPWIMGPWQWQTPGRGVVDSNLFLHTGFLVAAAADLASHACLWCPYWCAYCSFGFLGFWISRGLLCHTKSTLIHSSPSFLQQQIPVSQTSLSLTTFSGGWF